MNAFISRRYGVNATIVLCALLGISCENQRSRFAANSQGNLVTDTFESEDARPAFEGDRMPDGVARAHGKIYYVRNGQGTVLTKPQRFAQGLMYDGRGRIILRDGTVVRLTQGEMITFAGDRITMPPSTRLP
jgi:hypothetical protein